MADTDDYKTCENYTERPWEEMKDILNDAKVVGCKCHGIKSLCVHPEMWETCLVSRSESIYLTKYRLKTRTMFHVDLRKPRDRRKDEDWIIRNAVNRNLKTFE